LEDDSNACIVDNQILFDVGVIEPSKHGKLLNVNQTVEKKNSLNKMFRSLIGIYSKSFSLPSFKMIEP
jgi:hypothetical protein